MVQCGAVAVRCPAVRCPAVPCGPVPCPALPSQSPLPFRYKPAHLTPSALAPTLNLLRGGGAPPSSAPLHSAQSLRVRSGLGKGRMGRRVGVRAWRVRFGPKGWEGSTCEGFGWGRSWNRVPFSKRWHGMAWRRGVEWRRVKSLGRVVRRVRVPSQVRSARRGRRDTASAAAAAAAAAKRGCVRADSFAREVGELLSREAGGQGRWGGGGAVAGGSGLDGLDQSTSRFPSVFDFPAGVGRDERERGKEKKAPRSQSAS